MINVLQFVLCFCAVGHVYAKSDTDSASWFVKIGMECSKDHQITPEELNRLRQQKMPETDNAKCLLSCVYRKAGFFNDKGMFDLESATKAMESHHGDDTEKIESSKKLFVVCKTVNDDSVTDGDKGCQRASLLTKCFLDNSGKFGFKI